MKTMTHREIEEKEIIERYVLHQLSSDERRAFQEHYFECDECFERAQIEARFIASVRGASTSGVLIAENEQRTPISVWASTWLRPALAFSLAASLVLAVALVWLWLGRAQLERQLASELQARQTTEASPQNSIENAKREAEEKQRQLEGERARLQQPTSEASPTPRQSPSVHPRSTGPTLATITLQPRLVRAPSAASKLVITSSVKSVRIQLDLERDEYTAYLVRLTTIDGREIWRGGPIRSSAVRTTRAIIVSLPVSRLSTGDYLVELSGIRDNSPAESLPGYFFSVFR